MSAANEYDQLLETLKQFHSTQWLNQCFDLIKKLLSDLELSIEDPRLAVNMTKSKVLNITLGQRYVVKPEADQKIRIITPMNFDEHSVNGRLTWLFSHQKQHDAKWIEIKYETGKVFPASLYKACIAECNKILEKSNKSGYRKFHSELLYTLIMGTAEERNEVLQDVFAE